MPTTRGQEFTSSGTFNVPADVSCVLLTMVAGGGGGAPGRSTHSGGGGGGGAGEFCVRRSVKVTPLAAITVTIGSGGTGGVFDAGDGGDGTDTSFGTLAIVRHGYGGHGTNNIPPGTFVGAGGGYGGGAGTSDDVPANKGTGESYTNFGGASGAGSPGAVSPPDLTGGACGPNAGGTFTDGVTKGGGGGAASMWGPGGNGGIGVNQNGSPPPAGSFGGGGGGSTGGTGTRIGGIGMDGYCLVEWVG